MESDFGAQVAGGEFKPMDFLDKFTFFGLVQWQWGVIIVMVILIVLVIAFFFGWIGTAVVKNKEGLKDSDSSCLIGNSAAKCKQIRDGPGENLTNSALALGFGADPNAFCKSAGDDTTDPWDFVRKAVEEKETIAEYANRDDRFDEFATAAMAGH